MLESALRDAISAVVERGLSSVSDRIVRVEVSRDWPIAEALQRVHKRIPLRVLVKRPFSLSKFSHLKATEEAGEATAWRNEKKPRGYGIVIVGTSSGNLAAGLKDGQCPNFCV
jgi:hypothetical protein